MFVIGGSFRGYSNSFEVFDSDTRNVTSIQRLQKWIQCLDPNKTACVGYNIYCFLGEANNEVKVHNYHIKKTFLVSNFH